KPGAVEEYPREEIIRKIGGKVFAITSKDSSRVTLKSTPAKQSALIQHPHIEVAPYVGRYGWVTIDMVDEETLQLALKLADESYELAANPKKRGRSRA